MPYLFARDLPVGSLPKSFAALLLSLLAVPLLAQTSAPCSDPSSPDCFSNGNNTAQTPPANYQQNAASPSVQPSSAPQRNEQGTQVYIDAAGTNRTSVVNPTRQNTYFPADPLTDMQRLAQAATGENLPVFGRDLFQRAPSTFAPADQIPTTADYLVGPGDEVLVRLWGPTNFNGQLTVDASGSVYIPQVGAVHVAGLRVSELQQHISNELRHSYRNFNLSVNLGHLRSIQVYVVGEARRPGAYTVSSLSTVLNVLFVSGGPNVQGSLRHIQVRRNGEIVSDLDLYDLVLRGDKSKDIRLEPNDTIFIPPTGPQAALAGSVRHPAIYELRGDTTVGALLDLAGGFTPTGSTTQVSLDRIQDNRNRAALTINLDPTGRATPLLDGDVIYANHISAAFQKSVTIRGNLANPGRFPWHPGMHLGDIIPDRMSLLTNDYWRERNRLGVPVPLFEPMRPQQNQFNPYLPMLNSSNRLNNQANGQSSYQQNYPDQTGSTDQYTSNQTQGLDPYQNYGTPAQQALAYSSQQQVQQQLGNNRNPNDQDSTVQLGSADQNLTRGSLADQQQAVRRDNGGSGRRTTINIPAPEIDWSYAVIERLNPDTLKSSLVPFNLEKLVQDHDPTQDLELQPGDVVTILSQDDIHVPQDQQTKFVRLEGEFLGAGVYSVAPDETLDDLVRRAGGLSPKAYLYGASFTRESARVFQQQRLDEYVSSLSINMQRAAAVRTASSASGVSDPNALLAQQDIVSQLRKLRATGRIVLEFHPDSSGIASIPRIPLEDGDVFRVPSKPLTVSVIGAVYGQNVFLFDPRRRVEDYVLLAGKPNPIADQKHAFIIRADGSVYSRERSEGSLWRNGFDATQINPGDAIVIPEKPIKESGLRQFIDYSTIFSQFALSAAALSVIKQ